MVAGERSLIELRLQWGEPALCSPLGGVGGVYGYDGDPCVVGHLGQAVPQLGGRKAGDVTAEPLAPPAMRRTVAAQLAALGAGNCEVEVPDDDGPAVVQLSDLEDLGDRSPDAPVSGAGRQTVQDERDRARHPDHVAVIVEHTERQVPDVEVDCYHRATAQLVQGGDWCGSGLPGGVYVPAGLGRVVGDVVADGRQMGLFHGRRHGAR